MSTFPTAAPTSASVAFRNTRGGLANTSSQKDHFDITKRRHPRFGLLESHWRFMRESYNGGPEYLLRGIASTPGAGQRTGGPTTGGRNLFKYFKEGASEYNERLERAARNNYSKKVVNQIRSFVARKPADRKPEEATETVRRVWENADRKGRTMDRFMMLQLQWAATFGLVWVLVDKPKGEFDNREDELEDGLPFVKTYFPYDVLDASFDDLGTLNWVLLREMRRMDEDPLAASPALPVYILWDKVSRRVFVRRSDPENPFTELVGEHIDHKLGFVPIHPIRFTESDDPFVAPGLIDDIAYLDRRVFNNHSRLDTIINDQTFSQLTMPTDAVLIASPTRHENDDAVGVQDHREQAVRERLIDMGTKRVVLYNAAASAPPKYISPDATQADTIRTVIKDDIEEIYRLAGLLGEVGREVKTQTGVSKAYDFDRLNKLLAFASGELELAERWIATAAEKWMTADGAPVAEVSDDAVQYPRDFDIMGLLEELDIAIRADEYNLGSPTAEGELRKRTIRRLMGPGASEPELETMISEVEKWVERRKKMQERAPLDPFNVPTPTEGEEPSQVRGAGGGARGPGEGPPTQPTRQQAESAEGGGLNS